MVMHVGGKNVTPKNSTFYDPQTEAGYEGLAGYLGELTQNVYRIRDRMDTGLKDCAESLKIAL